MRVFLTGATGFVGTRIIPELKHAGHSVLGLARSDAGAKTLAAAGVEVHRGDIENLESLGAGAAQSDAVIHCGFIHDFARFKEVCEADRRAIEALGAVLSGSNRPLIVTSGTGHSPAPGQPITEDHPAPPSSVMPRGATEEAVTAVAAKGVRTLVVRLPQVHDPEKQGLITYLISLAREKGVSAYVGEGKNRWAAGPVGAVAQLYRLVLEKGTPGGRYHAVAEEGVPMKDIAEAIGKRVKVPVASKSGDEAAAHFGWLSGFAGRDLIASSSQTQKQLGWKPVGPRFIADILAG